MQPLLFWKFRTLAGICLFTSFAGVIFQLISEERLDYHSVLFGFPLGLVFGGLELFLFPQAERWFRQWSFTRMLLFKTVLYTAAIYAVTVGVVLLMGASEERTLGELGAYLASTGQLSLVVYTLAIYGLLVFLLQVNRLLGEGTIRKFIRGVYHRPLEEERIFMFLDMVSSTTIAEHLGPVRFYTLLNEVFHEVSQPVLQTRAEIYKYVGDEVILTWKVEPGLEHSNCLRAFFLFRESLLRNGAHYLKKFGVQPRFKAGVHYGVVVSAQMGDLKQEIVYNGDTLNTAARIRDACTAYGRDCLVSGALMHRLLPGDGFQWERIDTVTLRGKETEVELFSVCHDPAGPSAPAV